MIYNKCKDTTNFYCAKQDKINAPTERKTNDESNAKGMLTNAMIQRRHCDVMAALRAKTTNK